MRRLLATIAILGPLLLGGCGEHRPTSSARAEVGAAAILEVWDRRRAAAWAHGSVGELRALYVDGSATGAADVRMLRAWRARGLVVDLTTQLLAIKVLGRSRDRLRLSVTDRVVRAEARDPGDPMAPLALPEDQPSTYVIALERIGDQWLVRETTAA